MGNTVIIEVTCYIDKPAEMGATIPRVDKDTGSINIAEREQTGTLLEEIATYAHAHLPRVCVKYGGGVSEKGLALRPQASALSAQLRFLASSRSGHRLQQRRSARWDVLVRRCSNSPH